MIKDMSNISDRMIKLVTEQLKVPIDQVTPDTRFRQDLKVPSLNLILLQVAIEEEFGIELKEADAINIVSLRTALEYLAGKGIKD
jgi:acyl carrier protein